MVAAAAVFWFESLAFVAIAAVAKAAADDDDGFGGSELTRDARAGR